MLEKEMKFYGYNRQGLQNRHLNKFLVIKGQRVIATYDTHATALEESTKTMPEGTFLIQHCVAPQLQE
jgi:hypothetical protein